MVQCAVWRFALVFSPTVFASAVLFAQEIPTAVALPPAKLSLPGRAIAVRPVDPMMSAANESQIIDRFGKPWGRAFHCISLQHFADHLNRVMPTSLNLRSIEEIGLSPDESLSLDVPAHETPLVTIARTLRDLDLTWTLRAGHCTIETIESAECFQLVRVYDVTPLVLVEFEDQAGPVHQRSDFQSLVDLIQITIRPDTWEALGGPSTFAPFAVGNRCLLAIATTTQTHMEIETLLNRLNELGYPNFTSPRSFTSQAPLRKSSQLPKFGRRLRSSPRTANSPEWH